MVAGIRRTATVAAIIASLATAVVTDARAQTQPQQIAIQSNLWGAMSGTQLNTAIGPETATKLQARLAEVFVVSLNEVCYWQWEEVQAVLTQALGYAPMAHWSIATPTDRCALGGGDGNDQTETSTDPNGQPLPANQRNTIYGNVIVGKVPQSGPWPLGASSRYQNQNDTYPPPPNPAQVPEYRGVACLYGLRAVYPLAGNVDACTTHLANSPDSMTRSQLLELTNGAASTVLANKAFIVMGDLNLEGLAPGATTEGPNKSIWIRDWWYPLFKEGDRGYGSGSKRSTGDFGEAIDYVFRRIPNSFFQDPLIQPSSNMDHHWFETYLEAPS